MWMTVYSAHAQVFAGPRIITQQTQGMREGRAPAPDTPQGGHSYRHRWSVRHTLRRSRQLGFSLSS